MYIAGWADAGGFMTNILHLPRYHKICIRYQDPQLLTQLMIVIPEGGTRVHQTTVNVASHGTLIHTRQIPTGPTAKRTRIVSKWRAANH